MIADDECSCTLCIFLERMYVQVIWKRLYKCSSGMDAGTRFQLQKLINRRNVVKDPSKSVAPCEEFFLLVVETHILAATMQLF
jgi:hypothetical protein